MSRHPQGLAARHARPQPQSWHGRQDCCPGRRRGNSSCPGSPEHADPQRATPCPRCCPGDTLLHRHLVVPQKPTDPNLARTAAAQTADRKAPGAVPDKTVMQEPPRPVHSTIPKIRHSPDHAPTLLATTLTLQNAMNRKTPQRQTHNRHKQPNEMCACGSP